jgi:hypothetical protein
MRQPRELPARDLDARRAREVGDRLQLMFEWYKGMVDSSAGRLPLHDLEKAILRMHESQIVRKV